MVKAEQILEIGSHTSWDGQSAHSEVVLSKQVVRASASLMGPVRPSFQSRRFTAPTRVLQAAEQPS